MGPLISGKQFLQLHPRLLGRIAFRTPRIHPAEPVADAVYVRIHNHAVRFAPRDSESNVRDFGSNASQFQQIFQLVRYVIVEVLNTLVASFLDALGFVFV